MYITFFYKVRELTLEDLPLLKSVAKMLQIDFSIYDVEEKDGKLFLSLKEKEKMKNIANGKMLKKLLDQRENIVFFFHK